MFWLTYSGIHKIIIVQETVLFEALLVTCHTQLVLYYKNSWHVIPNIIWYFFSFFFSSLLECTRCIEHRVMSHGWRKLIKTIPLLRTSDESVFDFDSIYSASRIGPIGFFADVILAHHLFICNTDEYFNNKDGCRFWFGLVCMQQHQHQPPWTRAFFKIWSVPRTPPSAHQHAVRIRWYPFSSHMILLLLFS